MAGTIAVDDFRRGFLAVLQTVVARSQGYFLEPEAALFETLATVSAEEASRPVGAHGSTLAAQVAHVTVYLAARNEQLRTRQDHPVDWAAAWQTGAVTEGEWSALVAALRAEYEQQLASVRIIEGWDETMIADACAVLGHCAYHLGEIRQGLGLLRR